MLRLLLLWLAGTSTRCDGKLLTLGDESQGGLVRPGEHGGVLGEALAGDPGVCLSVL